MTRMRTVRHSIPMFVLGLLVIIGIGVGLVDVASAPAFQSASGCVRRGVSHRMPKLGKRQHFNLAHTVPG